MERTLASVVKIISIKPIPGADAIDVARVKGWDVVVKKNEYQEGQLVVYYEIDSFLPVKPEFEFLRKSSYKKLSTGEEGFRLKTIKLKGQISQGLITPLPAGIEAKEGDDLTAMLGITKYEPPIPAQLSGEIAGLFPSFIPKTDEERVQNITEEALPELYEQSCYITEKLDGTSYTIFYVDGKVGVCSRNYELKDGSNVYWQITSKLKLVEKLKALNKNIALQGEIIGPGIQKNIYNLKEISAFFFTGYDIEEKRRMSFEELSKVLNQLELVSVPVTSFHYVLPPYNLVDTMLELANDKSLLCSSADREGIVVRGLNKQFSFKAISNAYLLKND